jgi:hypothetical protein
MFGAPRAAETHNGIIIICICGASERGLGEPKASGEERAPQTVRPRRVGRVSVILKSGELTNTYTKQKWEILSFVGFGDNENQFTPVLEKYYHHTNNSLSNAAAAVLLLFFALGKQIYLSNNPITHFGFMYNLLHPPPLSPLTSTRLLFSTAQFFYISFFQQITSTALTAAPILLAVPAAHSYH